MSSIFRKHRHWLVTKWNQFRQLYRRRRRIFYQSSVSDSNDIESNSSTFPINQSISNLDKKLEHILPTSHRIRKKESKTSIWKKRSRKILHLGFLSNSITTLPSPSITGSPSILLPCTSTIDYPNVNCQYFPKKMPIPDSKLACSVHKIRTDLLEVTTKSERNLAGDVLTFHPNEFETSAKTITSERSLNLRPILDLPPTTINKLSSESQALLQTFHEPNFLNLIPPQSLPVISPFRYLQWISNEVLLSPKIVTSTISNLKILCDDAPEKVHFHSDESSYEYKINKIPDEHLESKNSLLKILPSPLIRSKITEEDPKFNEWQFWKLPFNFNFELPLLVCSERNQNLYNSKKSFLPSNSLQLFKSSSESESSLEDEDFPSLTYVLTPCSDCSSDSNNYNYLEPPSFWASGLNFCGHPRLLLLYKSSKMGNQTGTPKEPVTPSTKKSKGLGILRRGDTKGNLQQSEVNSGVASVATSTIVKPTIITKTSASTGITKNRAPPPPPTIRYPSVGNDSRVEDEIRKSSGDLPPGNTSSVIVIDDDDDDEFRDTDDTSLSRQGSSLSNNFGGRGSPSDLSSFDEDGDYSLSETLAETYRTAVTGPSNTGSYYSAVGNLSPLDDDGDDDTLRNQSDELSIDSVQLLMMPTELNGNGLLVLDDSNGELEDQVFGSTSIMNSAEINGGRASTASFPLTLTRKRKVELSSHSVSSPEDELHPTSVGYRKDAAGSEQFLPGSNEDYNYSSGDRPPLARRFNSVTEVIPESNVLRKVASLTLAEQQTQLATLQAKTVSRPKLVPEKLDFRLYEKFEGQMLVHWFLSCFDENVKESLLAQDLKFIANQFSTLLLAAGVLKQIEEKSSTEGNRPEKIFRPDLIYYWSHSESPAVANQIPGKLPLVSWPPIQEISPAIRNGAKYTEAGEGGIVLDGNSRTLSPEHLPEPGTVPKTVSHFESECDLSRLSSTSSITGLTEGLDNSTGEFQQMVMGLKRSHKESMQKKVEEHELEVFTVRGETEEAIEKKFVSKIQELEKELETLRTLINIQNLTARITEDFKSGRDEAQSGISNSKNIPPPPPFPLSSTPPPKSAFPPAPGGPPIPPPMPMTGGPPIPPPMPMTGGAPIPPPMPMTGGPPLPPPMPMTGGPPIPPPMPMTGGPPLPPPMPMTGGPPLPPPMPMTGGPPMPPPLPMTGGPPMPPPFPMSGGPPMPPPMMGQVMPSPPPGSTAPSLPAPPPGGWQVRVEARKKPISPKLPMKPLYWTRIQIKVQATPSQENLPETIKKNETTTSDTKLWEKLEEVSVGSWDDFTDLFSRQIIEKKEAKEKKEEKVPSMKAISVLDSKRAQNVGIFIRSNKFEDEKRNPDISKIKEAIFELDLSSISLETLEKILDIKPTETEYALMKDHVQSNPDMPLEKADKFLYDLNSIQKFTERIMCFTFQFTFSEQFTTIETKLSNFRLVCEGLMSSKDLKNVMALILTYGNYMNGGNMQRGQADGFTLDILPKLRDVKSKDNSYTFLHFIVSRYIKNYDELRGTTEAKLPIHEPSDIEAAGCLNFEDIESDLHKLQEKLTKCEVQANQVISSSTPDTLEPFKSKMLGFLEQAKGKVQDVEESLEEGKKTFVKTMKFFDYTPKPKKPGELPAPFDFFQPWNTFCQDFKEIWKNEQQRIFKEKLKASEQYIQSKRIGVSKLQKQPKKAGGLKDKIMERISRQRQN